MNQKDQRILKLHDKGMTEAQIAKKIGYGAPAVIENGVQRVREALARHRPPKSEPTANYGVEKLPETAQLLS